MVKNAAIRLSDHLSLQEKYSIIILHVFLLKIRNASRTFSFFSFFQDFSRPGYLFFHSPGFPSAWEP